MTDARTNPFTVALIDLDGTITDSAPGILATLTHTLQRMGVPVPAPAELVAFVGPPILDGFRDVIGLDPAQSALALQYYRERYRAQGAFDSHVYEGVPAMLDELRAVVPLAVATSKPEHIAREILAHFALTDRFVVIAGASADETRSAKDEVITWALAQLREQGVDTSRPVMIGDRSHDVHGAGVHGIPTIFAGWGYGAPEEAVGTVAIAERPGEMASLMSAL